MDSEVVHSLKWLSLHSSSFSLAFLVGVLLLYVCSLSFIRYESDLSWLQSALCGVLLFHIVIAIGLGIKAQRVGYLSFSKSIASIVQEKHLVLAKELRQEVFDPVVFYLDREIEVVSLDEGIESCRDFLMMREEDLSTQHEDRLRASELSIAARFNAAHREKKGKFDRAMLLIRCS